MTLMERYDTLIAAQKTLLDEWGDAGKEVIAACILANGKGMTMTEFLEQCTACGGNWGGMLLSGVKHLWPQVWEIVPNDMGHDAFFCICCVLQLLGVKTEK